ncbi:hypothetical protein GCM10011316_22200 [Roseibium aquae]|uniref:DUF2157 domain-containing protein n=1 Tax=Roseibium aquae TaxID=1323746 RepID=A0A916TL78_9HYPH|nr:DUF2157 domain-containing protein [Roseibium aquae]GGB49636.1 hypothetical protein GCM10011316_22200 [Roseibium aquae]
MFDSSYHKRLRRDLELWQAEGWVTPQGAARILSDLESGDGRSRLPMVLGGIGVVCVALAVAAFIAANWEGIGKAEKLVGIAVLVLGSHMLAARWAARGRRGIADLATAFATLTFVAGMALVGQIFHLPADWAGGSLLVCLGALAAAWLAGSRASLLVAAVAAILWQTGRAEIGETTLTGDLIGLGLLVAVALHPAVHPMRLSRWAGIALFLVTYGRWLADTGERLGVSDGTGFAMVLLGTVGVAATLIQAGAVADLYVKWCSDYPDRSQGRWLLALSAQDFGVAILAGLAVVGLFVHEGPGLAGVWTALTIAPVFVPVVGAVLLNLAGFLLSFATPKARGLFAAVLVAGIAIWLPLLVPNLVLAAAGSLTALIAVSLMGTLYKNGFWTFCGYAGLAVALLWLLHETVGSLLGQAVFFLLAGLLLLGLAVIAGRWLTRSRATAQEPGEGTA